MKRVPSVRDIHYRQEQQLNQVYKAQTECNNEIFERFIAKISEEPGHTGKISLYSLWRNLPSCKQPESYERLQKDLESNLRLHYGSNITITDEDRGDLIWKLEL